MVDLKFKRLKFDRYRVPEFPHPMQLRSAKVQEVSLNEINIGDLLQSNSVIQWLSQYNICIIGVYSHSVHKLCIIHLIPLIYW